MAEFASDDSYFDQIAQQEQENVQRINADIRNKKDQKKSSVVSEIQRAEALAKKLKKVRNVYRVISIGSGVTVAGLVITFLVMNWQLLISGVEGMSMINGIGKNFGVKFVPSLSIGEFIFLLFLWLIIIIITGILMIIVYYFYKCGTVNVFSEDFIECARL